MKIYSVKLEKHERKCIEDFYNNFMLSAYLLETPIDDKEISDLWTYRSKIYSSSTATFTKTRIDRIMKVVLELQRRAIAAPVDNWKHWGYEKGRQESLNGLAAIETLMAKIGVLLSNLVDI